MDALDLCGLVAWECVDLVSDVDLTVLYLTLETSEGVVRTAHSLNRHIEPCLCVILCDIYILKVCKECGTLIPRNVL